MKYNSYSSRKREYPLHITLRKTTSKGDNQTQHFKNTIIYWNWHCLCPQLSIHPSNTYIIHTHILYIHIYYTYTYINKKDINIKDKLEARPDYMRARVSPSV